MWAQLSGYRLLLEHYWGLSALGFVAVGFGLANQIWGLCESLVMQYLFPLYYRRISGVSHTDGGKAFSDLLNSIGPAYLILVAVTLSSAPALLMLLVASSYGGVYKFVYLGALVECCRVLANVLGSGAQVKRRMNILVLPYALGAAFLTVSLVMAAVANWSLEQSLVALPLAAVVMFLAMGERMRRDLSIEIDYSRWGWAVLIVVIVAPISWFFPLTPKSYIEAFEILVGIGALSMICVFALTWKNHALKRLLTVNLRTGE
ncbi:hypothetical protein TSA66_00145 [Noviherbaspirillum autotrophicum]|uniref:Polysaccharide biosynthesis protein C-terminal domain-containing protein n=2 Tax=Noviherbaspirillum autotrophicum TaxID=709839 RepID=A0A0C2BSG0_9BURK|nr:hypothetical protein TSA66_20875 [Noviherbaspirillum autotrophicum]KIF84175.1 hypothetical protein TSA66_00145 [Noviherbaspirillum autotrophicum]